MHYHLIERYILIKNIKAARTERYFLHSAHIRKSIGICIIGKYPAAETIIQFRIALGEFIHGVIA